jgi:hypothetical protein
LPFKKWFIIKSTDKGRAFQLDYVKCCTLD